MAATMATTMAVLNAKILTTNVSKPSISYKQPQPIKPINLFSNPNLPKGLTTTTTTTTVTAADSSSITGTALAGAFFYTISSCNPAFAAQQIAEIAAEGSDSRGLALLLPIIPAIAWVLFNILQPALNQINRMRSVKGAIIGVGLGGLATTGLLFLDPLQASAASEIGMIAEGTSDNRGQLLLFVIAPAIGWVLYNILQPALNQINKMRSQ